MHSARVRSWTAEGNKYRRLEEESLIPIGFGWTVLVMALYIALVVLK